MLLMFQKKTNIESIGFYLIHFEFVLDSSDIHVSNIDLLNRGIPSKHFVCLQDLLRMSSRHVFKTSSA